MSGLTLSPCWWLLLYQNLVVSLTIVVFILTIVVFTGTYLLTWHLHDKAVSVKLLPCCENLLQYNKPICMMLIARTIHTYCTYIQLYKYSIYSGITDALGPRNWHRSFSLSAVNICMEPGLLGPKPFGGIYSIQSSTVYHIAPFWWGKVLTDLLHLRGKTLIGIMPLNICNNYTSSEIFDRSIVECHTYLSTFTYIFGSATLLCSLFQWSVLMMFNVIA